VPGPDVTDWGVVLTLEKEYDEFFCFWYEKPSGGRIGGLFFELKPGVVDHTRVPVIKLKGTEDEAVVICPLPGSQYPPPLPSGWKIGPESLTK